MMKRIVEFMAVSVSIAATLFFIFLFNPSVSKDWAVRNKSGKIETSGKLDKYSWAVGDCLNNVPRADSKEKFGDVLGVPCSQPHSRQIYFIGEVTNLAMPEYSQSIIKVAAQKFCLDITRQINISANAKIEYATTPTSSFYPDRESWNSGYKIVHCVVGHDTDKHKTSIFD